MPAPAWVEDLIGIPWVEHGRTREGADCWGLVMLAAKKLGLDFPDYGYRHPRDKREIGALVRKSCIGSQWREVGFVERKAGDVVTFNVLGYPAHVGIVVNAELFLHVQGPGRAENAPPKLSVCERFTALNWRHRIEGVFRFEGRGKDEGL